MKSIKRIFKEKTSIKAELQKALDSNTPMTITILSKLVGISVYRVRKYCKTHNIDLTNYSSETLKTKAAKKNKAIEEDIDLKKKKKKIGVGNPTNIKIQLTAPTNIKVKID
jgi:hypothetical protein